MGGEGGGLPIGPPVLDVGVEFVHVRRSVECFAARDGRDVSAAEVGEQIVHLSQTRDIISRERAKLTGVFSATDEAEKQGSNCATDWIRHQAKMSVSDVLQLQVVGRYVNEIPLGSAAVDERRIGFGNLVHLARNAASSARSRTGAFDEVPLLPLAEEESVSRFRHTCLNARHAQDPEGYVAAEVSAVESRELTINALDDGTTWFNVRLDATAAAITQSVLEGMSKHLGPDDHRTKPRRFADSFVVLSHAPLTEFTGREPVGQHVHINVTCTAATLLNLPGAPAAEIEYGLACNAAISKVLLDDNLVPVAVGHMKRALTRRERRGLNTRDRHCRYPGCDRPPSQCGAHHVEWYSRGGQTKLSNMLLLCAHHHWRVHEGGWQLPLAAGGAAVVVPPVLQPGQGSGGRHRRLAPPPWLLSPGARGEASQHVVTLCLYITEDIGLAKDLFRLDDKVALITGGSRGIGRSIAEEFARRGARVVISARKQEELDETAKAITDEGGEATAIAAHAAKEDTIKSLVDQVMDKYGRIDILVNNAATNVAFMQLSDLDIAAWDKTLEVNLRGPFILSKEVVNRWMKEHGGNIINVCSIAGFRGDPNMGAYSVSKAALVMLTKVQARELGAYGIRVNGIAPAVIKTKFSRVLYETDEIRAHAEGIAALGRVGEWNEVAGTAVYLASDASSYVTGSIALVDGGTLA